MDKISIFIVAAFLSITSAHLGAQTNNRQAITTNEQVSNIFYHIIERGQTVYSIATMYGISIEDIYRLNPESRNEIKAGATLKIPQRDAAIAPIEELDENFIYHTIQPKETLYSLSVKYAVPATDIIEANPGLSTSTFTIGKTIRIPATRIDALPTTEVQTVAKEIEYKVEKKETIYRISRKFNISSAELVQRNPQLKSGIKAGMIIKIPVETQKAITKDIYMPEEAEVNALLSKTDNIQRVNKIKVALLLPFMTEEVIPSASTERFIEYYEGLLIAVDSLRNNGYSIDLSVFDTGNGTNKIKSILQQDALRNANLIIGAVQNEQIDLVADFAQANNIKYVIPFTSKNDNVLLNSNIFQVNTPHSYLYSKAAHAGRELFRDDNIIILNIVDREEKTEFIKAFKDELQLSGIPYKELIYSPETFTFDIETMLSPIQRNIILPTSASLDALNKIRSPLRMLTELAVDRRPYTISLFGYPEWQTYTRECLEDFFVLNTYIYSNFFADNLSPEVQRFYGKYKNWYSKNLIRTYPKYGILGFDTGMFFIEAIRKYGINFENHLNKIYYPSLQTGFHFERVNNWGGFINTNLFIIQYKNDYSVIRKEI